MNNYFVNIQHMDISVDIIQKALEIDNISYLQLATIADFTEKEIEMVKIFWEPAFNKSWIYLSIEIIHDYFGYKKTESSNNDFIKKIKDNYKKDIDYKEVSKDHELIKLYHDLNHGKETRGGSLKKYYIVPGSIFKKLGMKANTIKGEEICDYFIKVESLCHLMIQYENKKLLLNQKNIIAEKDKFLLEQQIIIKDKENIIKKNINENKWIDIVKKTNATFAEYENKSEGLYLGSHVTDADMYIYKFGKSTNNRARVIDHSVSTSDINEFKLIKTYTSYKELHLPLEGLVQALLTPFSVNKKRREHFMINPIFMDELITKILVNIDDCVIDINEHLKLIKKHNYDYEIINNIFESTFEKLKISTDDVKLNQLVDNTTNIIRQMGIIKCSMCSIFKSKSEYTMSTVSGKNLPSCKVCNDTQANYNQSGNIKCRGCSILKPKVEYDTSDATKQLHRSCKMCRNKIQIKKCIKCNELYDINIFEICPSGYRSKICNVCKEK